MPHVFTCRRPLGARLAIFAISALLAAGCTYEHSRQTTHDFLRQSHLVTDYQIKRSDSWVLSSEAPVCLVPASLAEQPASAETRPRAHQQLGKALYKALAQNFVVVQVPHSGELLNALQASALRGCSVMIMPHILDAQDQLNSWTEMDQDLGVFPDRRPGPDNLVVRVAIYSVVEAQPLDIATVHARTGVWTFSPRTPSDMFDNAMQAYVAAISNKPHAG